MYEKKNVHVVYIYRETENHFLFHFKQETFCIHKDKIYPLEYRFLYNFMYCKFEDCIKVNLI